jgi:hypothetical protein
MEGSLFDFLNVRFYCVVYYMHFRILMKNRSGVTGIELSRWFAAINQASVLLL